MRLASSRRQKRLPSTSPWSNTAEFRTSQTPWGQHDRVGNPYCRIRRSLPISHAGRCTESGAISKPQGEGEVVAVFLRISCTLDTELSARTLADFEGARDSQISFSVSHGMVGFWRGRPWLAGRRIGKRSLDAFSSRFWIGWVTRRGDKCVRSTCRG